VSRRVETADNTYHPRRRLVNRGVGRAWTDSLLQKFLTLTEPPFSSATLNSPSERLRHQRRISSKMEPPLAKLLMVASFPPGSSRVNNQRGEEDSRPRQNLIFRGRIQDFISDFTSPSPPVAKRGPETCLRPRLRRRGVCRSEPVRERERVRIRKAQLF
jgi:hypothetical protein